jgi:hypothetical protein
MNLAKRNAKMTGLLIVAPLIACSMILNGLGAYSDTTNLSFTALLIATLSALSDAIKVYAVSFINRLYAEGRTWAMSVPILIVVIGSVVSINYAYAFFGTKTDRALTQDQEQADRITKLDVKIKALRTAVAAHKTTRAVFVIESEEAEFLSGLIKRGKRRVVVAQAVKNCPSTRYYLRAVCKRRAELAAELKIARGALENKKKLEALEQEQDRIGHVAKQGSGTEKLLVDLTGLSLASVIVITALFKALALEITASGGVFLLTLQNKKPVKLAEQERDLSCPTLFAERFLIKTPGERVQAAVLYERYCAHCTAHRLEAKSLRVFGDVMSNIVQLPKERLGGKVWYIDLSLKTSQAA